MNLQFPAQSLRTGRRYDESKSSVAARQQHTWLHPSDLLLLAGFGLWIFGLRHVATTHLGPYGLPPDLPTSFYVGLAVVIVSATCELMRARLSPWRMAAHAVILVFMLFGTAPLVYPVGRYEWLYKTVGVVQYVNAHGQLNRNIDIYQNWPGFFAFAAWFDKVAGVSSPLYYAKWAQVVFELAAIPLLYLIYSALFLSVRQRWTAILLYSASNWIGQDYFSPQAFSTVLGLGLMAIVMRWLYATPSPIQRSPRSSPTRQRSGIEMLMSLSRESRDQRFTPRATAVLAILVIFWVITFTHQLTPYMLAEQLAALAAVRLIRPRWLPLALAGIAIAYLIPRYSFVSSHYGLTRSLGNFFANLRPPSFSAPNVSGPQQFIQRCTEVLSAGIWVLAGLGAWLNRRSGRPTLGLLLLAYSPVLVLILGSYGSEGILRVYLFSLPWSAALAATVLSPQGSNGLVVLPSRFVGIASTLYRRCLSIAEIPGLPKVGARPGLLRIPLTLGLALTLFFPSFFGDDAFNYMTKAEVDVTTSFWLHAQPGHVLVAIDRAPIADTWRYNLFPVKPIFGSALSQSSRRVTPDIAAQLAQEERAYRNEPVYFMMTTSMVMYNDAYGITKAANFAILMNSLRRSTAWTLLLHRADVVVYELPPQQQSGSTIP